MKESDHIIVSTINPRKKRKKRKGGMSFNNSKQRKRRELNKKEETCIEGRGTSSNLENTCGEGKRGPLNWHLNLQSIEEEWEDSDSHAPSMAESEHHNSSNRSGSCKETRDNSIFTVSLSLRLYAQGVVQDLDVWIYDIGKYIFLNIEDTFPHNRMSNMWIGLSKTRKNLEWVSCTSIGLMPTCPPYCKNTRFLYTKPVGLVHSSRENPTNKHSIRLSAECFVGSHNEGSVPKEARGVDVSTKFSDFELGRT